ncbi:heavy-metal-associated domain-containing protein [Dysgonomonas macrotermitis]|uniref:Copper chaperone CopZ n=1 Tax=Dysgonomonas macrotermitis TaxID=1346286 RepID=A0A1M4TWG7_9BACT|nr:heavy metal-associated domain-containing protein [Dysgonomonas macrotermitis]SHE48825.1 Copper chaperone CopZ [Dysgonomonas macrotermitis]
MKTKIFLFLIACFTAVSINVQAQSNKEKKSNKEEVTFDVSMTCQNCQKKIEKNIAFEKGVSDMNVDLPAKTVMIVYNPAKTNVGKLQEAIEKLGYTATVHNKVENAKK